MKYIYSGTCDLNSKKYYIFLNKETWKKEFFILEDNKYKRVSEDEERQLNEIFNSNRPIFIEKKRVVAALASGILVYISLLSLSPLLESLIKSDKGFSLEGNFVDVKTTITTNANTKETSRAVENLDLQTIVNNNFWLIPEEKVALIEDLQPVYDDNPNFIRKDLLKTIGDVQIFYRDEFDDNPIAAGYYQIDSNNIYLLKDEIEYAKGHEELHCFFNHPDKKTTGLYDYGRHIGKYLNEGFISKYDSEKKGKSEGTSYANEEYLVMILTEIIGDDVIKAVTDTGDLDLMINELAKIDGTYYDAISLLSIIDTYGESVTQKKTLEKEAQEEGKSEKEVKKLLEDAEELGKSASRNLEEAKSRLKKYYEVKYEREVEDDILVSAYLNLCNYGAPPETIQSFNGGLLVSAEKNYFFGPAVKANPEARLSYKREMTVQVAKEGDTGSESKEYETRTEVVNMFQDIDELNRYTDKVNENPVR